MDAQGPSAGTVRELWRFPVKSMLGERIDRATLTPKGIEGDRRYAVRDAETRNVAEARQWQTEKFLAESGDKLPSNVKEEINDALGDLRSALGGNDIDRIKAAHTKLDEVSQKAGASLYEQNAAASGGSGESGSSARADDDVVDAEIIDDEGKKQ